MDRRDFGGHAVQAAHQQSDFLHRGVGGIDRLGQRSDIQDREAVAQGQQLVQVLGDHDDGGAVLGEVEQGLVDGGRRSGIDAPGRLGDHQHFGRLEDLAADDVFLEIAAGQAAGGAVRAARLDAEFLDDPLGELARGVVLDPAA